MHDPAEPPYADASLRSHPHNNPRRHSGCSNQALLIKLSGIMIVSCPDFPHHVGQPHTRYPYCGNQRLRRPCWSAPIFAAWLASPGHVKVSKPQPTSHPGGVGGTPDIVKPYSDRFSQSRDVYTITARTVRQTHLG
jgi:hypothetical protein